MSAAFVEEAAKKASWIIRQEVRGPGDIEPAMRRIEQRHGISYGVLWRLRYRKPSDLLVSTFALICDAYDAELERQKRLLGHEQTIEKAKTRFGRAVLAEVQAVVGEKDGALK